MSMTMRELEENALRGLTSCQIELAHCYLRGVDAKGQSIAEDPIQAKRWLEAAHASGAHTATTMLGELYRQGKGVPVDIDRAIDLFRQAAERGSYLACLHLARMYAHGDGVAQSRERASAWYEKAISFEDEVDDAAGLKEARQHFAKNPPAADDERPGS